MRRALLYRVQIGQHQLGIDHVDVVQRVDPARYVDDLGVIEAAHYMADGVGRADVAEKLVAQALAFACAFDQARDVDELHRRWHQRLRLDQRGDFLRAAHPAR